MKNIKNESKNEKWKKKTAEAFYNFFWCLFCISFSSSLGFCSSLSLFLYFCCRFEIVTFLGKLTKKRKDMKHEKKYNK